MPEIGAHLPGVDPLGAARKAGAELVQLFLGDPQDWHPPSPRPDASALRAAPVGLFVHAPYVMNVASLNNRIRIPSRKLLAEHARAAADLGARALIVHAGHVRAGEDLAAGIANWAKVVQRVELPLPIYIENTAGGAGALGRRFDVLARLFEALEGSGVGFCLDTCHAHAAGEELAGVVDRARQAIGRIDLVHANDSRDTFGSGRDRHASLGTGEIGLDPIAAVAAAAGAPIICETPEDRVGLDIELVRRRLTPVSRPSAPR
jgi:deoxyribonuclease-4